MKRIMLVLLMLMPLLFSGCENSINSVKINVADNRDDSESTDQDIQNDEGADIPEPFDDTDITEIIDDDVSPEINDDNILETPEDTDNPDTEPVSCDTDPVFCFGRYYVNTIDVSAGDNGSARQFRIYEPIAAEGKIPVIHFLHGYQLKYDYYDSILMQLCSHGFIVISSQSNHLNVDTSIKEAEKVTDFLNWLKENLQSKLTVTADFENFGIAGHSRGGKVTNRILNTDPTIAKSFFGLDPVDSEPPINGKSDPQSLNDPVIFTGESMFLGTEKGPKNQLNGDSAACAPEGDNSSNFYAFYPSPSHHIIAAGVGHLDMLDANECSGAISICSTCAGSNDNGMKSMFITYTGGLMTAFFNSTLKGLTEYENILNDPSVYPFATTVVEHK